MKTEREFISNGERYAFDFNLCSASKGWAQVDTKQDAWYYGTWANPFQLKTVNYCEGDLTVKTAETEAEFIEEIREMKRWNEESGYWLGIDPGLKGDIENRFKELGLGEFLH